MIKTILVPLQGGGSKSVLATSLAMARLFDAHIDCLYARPDVTELIAQATPYDVGTASVIPGFIKAFENEDEALTKRARHTFDEWRKAADIALADTPPGPHAVSTAWCEERGDALRRVVGYARFRDLTVLDNAANRPRLAPDLTSALLTGSGRPLLLASATPPPQLTKTIAIAWKETAEAARAVTAAMPLLAKAGRIVVLSADEEGRAALDCVECTEKLTNQLRWHGLKVEGHFVVPGGRTIAKAILESAHEQGASLLVMGGYSHSRARELIFGGVTQHVLDGVKLPVFMAH
jgi:nucleotide-binding universal stress UspA family protein